MRVKYWLKRETSEMDKESSTVVISKKGRITSIMVNGDRASAKARAIVTITMRTCMLVNGKLTNGTEQVKFSLENRTDIKVLGKTTSKTVKVF